MEKLKELSKLTETDSRNRDFVVFDSSLEAGKRPMTEADQHQMMTSLEFSESVPETVRSAFAVTRTLWVYGWYYWPFCTLAEFHALLCLDMALAIRISQEDKITDSQWRTPSLTEMLKRAVDAGWVTDEGIAHARRLRERSEELPSELFGAAPDLWQDLPQRYCRILLETLPLKRNSFAHPKHYSHGLPSTHDIKNVHGLIRQLFPEQGSGKQTEPH